MYKVKWDNHEFAVEKGQSILDAALLSDVDFPHNCQLGSCSTCKCQLISGQIRQLGSFEYALTPEEIDRDIILACQSTVTSDVTVCLSDDTQKCD